MTKPRKYHYWCDSYGYNELKIHIDDAHIGCHSGQCDDDIEFLKHNRPYLQKQLKDVNMEKARQYLKECGIDDVADKDDDEVLTFLLWMACGDVIEEARNDD